MPLKEFGSNLEVVLDTQEEYVLKKEKICFEKKEYVLTIKK